jgi:hypothetical protein
MAPRGELWAPARAESATKPVERRTARKTEPKRADTRASGGKADRASLTHETDGKGGLVLRSDR